MPLTSAFSNRQLSPTIANSSRTCALFYTMEKSTFAQTGQHASSFCQRCHAPLDRHAHTKLAGPMCTIYISANSPRKLYKICKNGPVLSSSFCTMWAKQQNNQSISPRNNRHFTLLGNISIQTGTIIWLSQNPYTLLSQGGAWVRGYTQAALLSLIYYWQDCFLPFNLAGVYCMYFTTPDLQGPWMTMAFC